MDMEKRQRQRSSKTPKNPCWVESPIHVDREDPMDLGFHCRGGCRLPKCWLVGLLDGEVDVFVALVPFRDFKSAGIAILASCAVAMVAPGSSNQSIYPLELKRNQFTTRPKDQKDPVVIQRFLRWCLAVFQEGCGRFRRVWGI